MATDVKQVDGATGLYKQAVDPTFQAARIALRPLDYNINGQLLGHYRCVVSSGATNSIAASGILASLRWGTQNFMVLKKIAMWAGIQAAVTAVADMNEVQAFIFRASTGNASGGSVATLTGNNQKNRVVMGTSGMGEIRICGAAALTAATGKTNDSQAFASGGRAFPALTIGQIAPKVDLYKNDAMAEHPIILAPNEGIEIQNVNTGPTTGAVRYFFEFGWAEVAVY